MQPSFKTCFICSKEDFFSKKDKIVMSLIISATLYLILALQKGLCEFQIIFYLYQGHSM